jgi:hypothetical protein
MNERIFTLIKLRNTARSVDVDKQDLPSIPERFDNKWIVGAGSSGNGRHASMLHDNLNKHKG